MKRGLVILVVLILVVILGYVYRTKLKLVYIRLGGKLPQGTSIYKTPGFDDTQKNDPLLQQFTKNNGLPDELLKYVPDHPVTDAEANKDDIYEGYYDLIDKDLN